MKKAKPTRATRRRASRCARSLLSRRRPLRIESLEDRDLLAGDLGSIGVVAEGEGPDPLIAVRLSAVDPQTFETLDAVHQGEEFVLAVAVEDLRPDASGTFGAYVDLIYPSEFFRVPDGIGESALIYSSAFANDRSGDVGEGTVDEFGGFASSTIPSGSGEQFLVGVRLLATQMGDAVISSNPADESPAHDMLLFDRHDPVPTDLVTFGSFSLRVLAPLPPNPVNAHADSRVVSENSSANFIDVLQNDDNSTGSPLVITSVDPTNARGEVAITNDGTHLSYTPPQGFVGIDQFSYTVVADGHADTANVTVDVQRVVSHADRVAYGLHVTDSTGKPVAAVTIGEDFVLHVTAEDLQAVPGGVFAAYLDVQYTTGIAEVAGPISYGAAYPNNQVGDATVAGEIDEVGAFANSSPLGSGAFEVFQIPFRATSPGRIVFEANPAEEQPAGQTLLYDVDEPVVLEDIIFGRASVTVVPALVAVDDTYLVSVSNAAQTFSVLDNDVNFGTGTLRIGSLDARGLQGTVSTDGLSITYRPPIGSFSGSEQFTYTATGPAGSSTAEVTIHLQPTSMQDDQAGIRLATTDLDGNEISSIAAGQEFLVQAFVQDLRDPDADRGLYAAYFDLLYERASVHPVAVDDGPVGPKVEFGPDYSNGARLDASVPGIFNEVGAFQTATTPLGNSESLLFSARFRAAASRGERDSFEILEDAVAELFVLDNDLPNSGVTTIQADPADKEPASDTLFYEPVEPVPFDRIRYGNATIEITADGGGTITSVSRGSAGGTISIADGGASLHYTPAPNFNGVETFTYSLDGEHPTQVSVNVLPVNDVPLAADDGYRVRAGGVLEVAANFGVAANDIDHDGDILSAQLVSGTSHGTLQLSADGSFTYVPDGGYLGGDSFTYVVTDGASESRVATVQIDVVSKPVSIRLEAIDSSGESTLELVAGESVVVRALVQDLRSPSGVSLGIGAAYLDIAYDAALLAPITAPDGPLGLEIQFSSAYNNGISGELLHEGLLDNIGAFQSDLQPLGGDELELFRLAFDSTGLRAVDDSFIVAGGTNFNRLHVLRNEADLRWEVTLDAQHAASSPDADVLYLDPAESVPEEDIHYQDATLTLRNGSLALQSISETESGAVVSIESNGVINYEPIVGFIGVDSFSYTVVDGHGQTATATVTVEVTDTWQNVAQPEDVNGDGTIAPLDALVIVNVLNASGPHELTGSEIGAFLDVNGDGSVSPIDVLLVINRLIKNSFSAEGESAVEESALVAATGVMAQAAPLVAVDATASNNLLPTGSSAAQAGASAEAFDSTVDGQRAASLIAGKVSQFGGGSTPDDAGIPDLLDLIAEDVTPLWDDFS